MKILKVYGLSSAQTTSLLILEMRLMIILLKAAWALATWRIYDQVLVRLTVWQQSHCLTLRMCISDSAPIWPTGSDTGTLKCTAASSLKHVVHFTAHLHLGPILFLASSVFEWSVNTPAWTLLPASPHPSRPCPTPLISPHRPPCMI